VRQDPDQLFLPLHLRTHLVFVSSVRSSPISGASRSVRASPGGTTHHAHANGLQHLSATWAGAVGRGRRSAPHRAPPCTANRAAAPMRPRAISTQARKNGPRGHSCTHVPDQSAPHHRRDYPFHDRVHSPVPCDARPPRFPVENAGDPRASLGGPQRITRPESHECAP